MDRYDGDDDPLGLRGKSGWQIRNRRPVMGGTAAGSVEGTRHHGTFTRKTEGDPL